MPDAQATIQTYFNQPEIITKLESLVQQFFPNPASKQGFWDVFELIKQGKFDVDSLPEYMADWWGMEIETALNINNKLFAEVYGDVYDELQDLYASQIKLEMTDVAPTVATEIKSELIDKYAAFINSSLFQNILASQELIKSDYWQNNQLEEVSLKNDFYSCINAGDKVRTVGILCLICTQGELRKFFIQDKRFIDFFGGYLERHQDMEEKNNFLKDPADKKYLVHFLKFILEKRLEFSMEESAMLGTGLGSLCRQSGEEEYADLAYGDESRGSFVWVV